MKRLSMAAALILFTMTTASLGLAAGGELDLPWHTVAGGGTTASCGGGFCLSGSMGQPMTGAASGGIYAMQAGFWAVEGAPAREGRAIYLPLILR